MARIGVDIGGTKIAVVVLDDGGAERLRRRVEYRSREYPAALDLLAQQILSAQEECGERCSVGIGMPGLIDPDTGLVENAYNTPYNKHCLKRDLEQPLGREVRFANDANCFALSEACDGAARGAHVVFGATLGTGVGGGITVGQRIIEGRHRIAGEWGHTPLPWMNDEEHPGPRCNCGRLGCIEQFLSGPAKNRERDAMGEDAAMARYADRLARALAMIINILDPDVIVVGGGMSKHDEIYTQVPPLLKRHVYWSNPSTPIVRAKHGDASGVRGAAMLWP
ncbi:MAG TPA: ROK family protein [Burkholderiales bacterium]|nr:ROK family protein [Burkholderiales bacterium]